MESTSETQTTIASQEESLKTSDQTEPIEEKKVYEHVSPSTRQVDVYIYEYVTKEGNLGKKYTAYHLKGKDKDGEIDIFRRYSDFDALRKVLITRWPGCYIPPIPAKQAVGNKDAKFVEERKRLLDAFLSRVCEQPYIHYSEEYQLFLRSKGDLEKTLNLLPKVKTEDITVKYTKVFSQLSGKEINNELILKIAGFQVALKKMSAYFENFRTSAEAMVQKRKLYFENLKFLQSSLLSEYEGLCISEYSNHDESLNIFSAKGETELFRAQNQIRASTKSDSFELVLDLIRLENIEIKAFLETIEQKEKYENIRVKLQEKQRSDTQEMQKVLAGKTTFKTMFSRKSKDEEISLLEKNISESNQEIEHVNLLIDLITLIIGYSQMDDFKNKKASEYYKIIKKLAKSESSTLKDIQKYWTVVLESPSLKLISQQ